MYTLEDNCTNMYIFILTKCYPVPDSTSTETFKGNGSSVWAKRCRRVRPRKWLTVLPVLLIENVPDSADLSSGKSKGLSMSKTMEGRKPPTRNGLDRTLTVTEITAKFKTNRDQVRQLIRHYRIAEDDRISNVRLFGKKKVAEIGRRVRKIQERRAG